MAKLTLKILSDRINALQAELEELKKKGGSASTTTKRDDSDIRVTRVDGPIATSFQLPLIHRRLWQAVHYTMRDACATYTYSGGTMNVSPEEASHFESKLAEFFSGDEEKGYPARKVEVSVVETHPKLK